MQAKVLNPHKEGFIRDHEISYENGAYHVQALKENALIGERKKIEPPIDIVSYKTKQGDVLYDKEEISIIQQEISLSAFQRKLNMAGQQEGRISKFDPNSHNPEENWSENGILVDPITIGAFKWHNQRNTRIELPEPSPENIVFHGRNPLSYLQKLNITNTLSAQMETFKSSCTSIKEYIQGLHAIIHGEETPQFLSNEASIEFDKLRDYLALQSLRAIRINDRTARGETGQFGTFAEVKQYAQMLLQHELKKFDAEYDDNLIGLEGDKWQLLCPVTSQELLQGPTTELGVFINENIRAITKVYDPKDRRSLQEQANGAPPVRLKEIANREPGADNSNKITLEDLIAANKALTNILHNLEETITIENLELARYTNNFTNQIAGFLCQLMNANLAAAQQSCQLHFLEPLQELTRAKILELDPNADASVLDPEPEIAPGAPQPRPQPEIIEVQGKNLLDPGMRAKLRQWFDSKNLDELVDSADRKTLSGKLSNGTRIAIHGSSIAIEKAAGETKLTDEALTEATKEIADMLIKAYGGADKVPPLKVTGTSAQQELIAEILRNPPYGLQVKAGRGQEEGAAQGHEAGARRP